MGTFSIWHWLVVLLVILVVFGSSKLRNLGPDLGAAIRGFKKSMQEGEDSDQAPPKPPLADSSKTDRPEQRG